MKPTKWDRRKELLALLPPARPLAAPSDGDWSALLGGLAADWRVFLAHAPIKCLGVATGGTGLDPLPGDTLPWVRQALTERLISGVFLVGARTVADHIEMLHSFSPHIPFLAVLDAPIGMQPEKLEFLLGWADRVLLRDEGLAHFFEPVLRRSSVPTDVLPRAGDGAAWRDFLSRLSRQVQDRFLAINAQQPDLESTLDWVAFLDENTRRRWEAAALEWRDCLPKKAGVALLPKSAGAKWQGRLRRLRAGVRILPYRDQEHALAQVNRVLAGVGKPRTLLLKPSARLSRVCVERLSYCARRHPLAAAVCADSVQREAEGIRQWTAFSTAWQLQHRGGYRVIKEASSDCALVARAAVAQCGQLDSRLGWDYAVKDLALRARQNGWHLFMAEDALVSRMPAASGGSPEGERFKSLFLRKWTLDPAGVLGDGPVPEK